MAHADGEPRLVGEPCSNQKVTIPPQKPAGAPRCREAPQPVLHLALVRACRVVTGPGFEQVAKDIEHTGIPGGPGQETQKAVSGGRPCGVEMKVGDEEDRHLAMRVLRTLTLRITTGSTGTSCIPSRFPVLRCPISSTISRPSMTCPKTV